MKRKFQWTEFHNFEYEVEVPDGLSNYELIEWFQENILLPTLNIEPESINTDWDNFYVEEFEE